MASESQESLYIAFLDDPKSRQDKIDKRLQQILSKLAKKGAAPTEVFEYLNGFTINLSEQDAQLLKSVDGVRSVTADAVANFLDPAGPTAVNVAGEMTEAPSASSLPAAQTDSSINGEWMTYGVKALWDGAPPTTNDGTGKFAFVLDTGITTSTNDLIVDQQWARSWISGVNATTDDNGHGTHVAGTIAGLAGNNLGVVGVAAGATTVPLKVLNGSGSGSYSNIISAINYATGLIVTNNLQSSSVINMSLGGPGYSPLDQAVVNAADQGVRFAIAAGNSFQDVDSTSPARTGWHPNVHTISAVDANYQLASFSNYDNVLAGTSDTDDVDYALPGVRVISWYRNDNGSFSLYYLSGTSMAAPHAAGALLMGGLSGRDPVFTPAGIQSDPFAVVRNDDTTASQPSSALLHFTLASATTLAGLDAQMNDIIGFDGTRFFHRLKGNDVGLGGIRIDGFQLLPNDDLLITLRSPTTIQGTSYDDSDIVYLDKEADGNYTASMYFDGSAVGLTRSGEAIEAFAIDPLTGNLLISTRGSFSVSGASGSGQDIIEFDPSVLGSSTQGSWRFYLDGSDVGLSDSSENINGIAIRGDTLYLTTTGNFNVSGSLTGANEDVFMFTPTQTGSNTAGNFGTSLFFDGSDWGLSGNSLAGFDL